MEQNYNRYDLRRSSKSGWSDNELYQSRHGNNPQYKHVYAYDGKGRIACFTARVPSNKVQRAPSEHQESGYNQLKEVLKFYKPPEISSCAIHPPKSSSRVKYDIYPKMYAKHRVDHDVQYKESAIDENHGLVHKGLRTQHTNTPYSFLFCSEYLKQRMDRKSTFEEVEEDAYFKDKDLLVKPETRDASCGNFSIKQRSSRRLQRVNTSKRIKRLVIYKRVYRTMKELEHLFKVSKSKWEMVLAKESDESVKDLPEDNNQGVQTSQSSSSSTLSDIKVVMTTSDTAIPPFELSVPIVSESSPVINSNAASTKTVGIEEPPPLEEGEAEPEPPQEQQPEPTAEAKVEEAPVEEKIEEAPVEKKVEAEEPIKPRVEMKASQTALHVSQTRIVEMKDASTECYLKKKRRRSPLRRHTYFGIMRDLSTMIFKELRGAFKALPKMSYVLLVTFYALP